MKQVKSLLNDLSRYNPLIYILAIGAAIRIFIVLSSDFPLNDGGMFYTMVADLQKNNYLLPKFTSYNLANIPFAYPPLGLYSTGLISDIFAIKLITVFRFFPALISIIHIPIFYLLAKSIFKNRIALLSTLIFATIPRSYEWQIIGGGVTRSFGLLFHLLTLYFVLKLKNRNNSKKVLFAASLSCLAAILSHPEWALFTLLTLLTFTVVNKLTINNFISLVTGGLILSSIWWMNIIKNHGYKVFWYAFNTNFFTKSVNLLDIYSGHFIDGSIPSLIIFLSLFGSLILILNKNYFLPLWLITVYLVSPRSGLNAAVIPISLISAYTLDNFFIPIIKNTLIFKRINTPLKLSPSKVAFLLISLIFITISIVETSSSIFVKKKYIFTSIFPLERDVMHWIKENTKKDAKFIVITPISKYSFGTDRHMEWFPALSERKSVATPQGTEWLENGKFYETLTFYNQIKSCYNKNINCIEETTKNYNKDFNYIYIYKPNNSEYDAAFPLRDELEKSDKFTVVYENNSALVYEKN